jgi:hypothetical protein
MEALAAYRARLELVQRQARAERNNPSRWPFREAAAVLSRFIPAELRPLDSQPTEVGWEDFLLDCEPASKRASGEWWQLRDEVRRETLRRMATRERMQQALAANQTRSDDELQRALTSVINGETPGPLAEMSREEVSALVTVRDWLGGILEGLPTESDLRRALVIAETLTPMRRLAGGDHFVGRQNELAALRIYVGVLGTTSVTSRVWMFVRETYYELAQRPPLLITGPGGVGKSSLVARFILECSEHFERSQALPFVYLDLDRTTLDAARPLSLVGEAALQLIVEWPLLEGELMNVVEQVRRLLRAEQSVYEGTRVLNARSDVIGDFGRTLATGSARRPVLFVIDTFEEAQYRGFDVVQELGKTLAELQKAAPMLRIVLVGRAGLTDQSVLPTRELKLSNLSREEAGDLLRRNITNSALAEPALINQIVDMIGTNPLSLKLASAVVNEQGINALKAVGTRNWMLLRVKADTVQARLHGRILAHIHDDDVRNLAKTGLVVRRFTEEVIRDVLAEPCGIPMDDPNRAHELMVLLGQEIALVVPAPDGSLRHRPELRALMMKDLVEEIPAATILDIHNRAVNYYGSQPPEPIGRAEEIYHRLMRGDDTASVDPFWMEGVQPYLLDAVEEVPPAARIWLSHRLGITPAPSLLAQAELEQWEAITARSVQRFLQSGGARSALQLLRKRTDRTDSSPLFHLESEALRLLGNLSESRAVAERGIEASARGGAPGVQRDLLMQLALVDETAGDAASALTRIEAAKRVPGIREEPIETVRLTIAGIRLLRKLGPERDEERRAAIEGVLELLTPDVRDELSERPALLREVVAELGIVRPDLLTQGLEVLGLDAAGDAGTEGIANALTDWDKRLSPSSAGGVSEIAQRAGLANSTLGPDWKLFVSQTGGRELSTHLMNWRAEMQPDRAVDKSVVDFYRSGVEAALLPRRSSVT